MAGCASCISPRSRDSFVRLKSESPKFRDAMRKKCQQRWRENRWRFLDKNRVLSENFETEHRDTFKNIIKDDLKYYLQFSSDVDKEVEEIEAYQNDVEDEEFKWFFSEYDKILEDDDNLANLFDELETDQVFCPICEKSYLTIQSLEPSSIVTCMCGLRVPTLLKLSQIKENINNFVEIHNNSCDKKAGFTVINDGNNVHVYLCCSSCCSLSVLF